jgi:hypothetical protein
MTQSKLGYLQRDMLDFISAYGRCALPRDRDSQRVALSLAQRELIGINRNSACWTVWPTRVPEKLTA